MMKRYTIKHHFVHSKRHQQGYLLILVMITSLALMMLGTAIMSVTSAKYAKTSRDVDTTKAVYAAEAGVSDTLAQLNINGSFNGYTPSKKIFYSSDTLGKAEYTTKVTDNGNDTLNIESTSYMSRNPTSNTPLLTKTIKVLVLKTKVPVTENVVAGAAGLTMSGGFLPWYGQPVAMAKGSIYSRGKINLNGVNTSIGTTTDSARVSAANIGCGTPANWPQSCASNDPPITFGGGSWYSSGTGMIYGSVCATNQPPTSSILPGPTGTGLQAGCVAPDYGTPTFDKKTFTSNAVVPLASALGSCGVLGFGPPLPTAWVDKSRYLGNVSVSGSYLGDCNVTVMGDVYIMGDLTINAKTRITVSDTLGGRRPVIVVNGKVNIDGGSYGVFANSSGSPLTIISFDSSNSGCSSSDTCTSVSPADLYASSNYNGSNWYSYSSYGVNVNNGNYSYGAPNSQADLSGLMIYSYFGTTNYALSGNHSMRGIGGQGVIINPSGGFTWSGGNLSVTDTTPFTGVLGRTKYVLGDYQQIFN